MKLGNSAFELADARAEQERQAGIARVRAFVAARCAHLPEVASPLVCDCGAEIPEARRRAVPSATRCYDCETFIERQQRRRA